MFSGASGGVSRDGDGGDRELFKVLVVGDYAVGKTSLIKRYTTGEFSGQYRITIGVDFCSKDLEVDGKAVTLQLWDIAGNERFGSMTRVYYKHAAAAVVVFDLTRRGTLESARKWRTDVNAKVVLPNNEPVPMLLVANKCDIKTPETQALKEELDAFARENGFFAWVETSSLANLNIDHCFSMLAAKVVKATRGLHLAPLRQQEAISFDRNSVATGNESKRRCNGSSC
eukprot:TRINITY_DN3646_c0_g1_i1.p1 TRINITY_DN3646_c0_g1~~TRINITY_DN3646_c0_g1_i1.p1  ORF type:complete len:228 (+),score=79.32 TRINITY_DN3646_c0_g1_i1:77-760(+)